MTVDAYNKLENVYDEVVRSMKPEFDSHTFILELAQKHQKLYIEALYSQKDKRRPFHRVHMAIAKRLKKRTDLVEHFDDKPSLNIFGEKSTVAVWRKV